MAQNTQAPPRGRNVSHESAQQLTVIPAERLPVPIGLAERFGYDRSAWRALCEAVFPSAKTPGAIVLALAYCKARKLDPFKRCVHIVPMWNSVLNREVETVWPGIAEHRITASRTGDYAGNDPADFGPLLKKSFSAQKTTRQNKIVKAEVKDLEFPEWCQFTVYRMVQGQRIAFAGPRVYFLEYFGYRKGLPVPNERWTRAPRQMLEKCAEAAALRRAYPECSEPVAEEMEGRVIDAGGSPVPTKEAAPTAADFPNSAGVPQDGVTQVADDEDGEDFSDDPAFQVVEPNNQTAQAAAASSFQNVTAEQQVTRPKDEQGAAPQAQASPPAAVQSEAGDGRPEPPPPDGVVADSPAPQTASDGAERVFVLDKVIDKAIEDLAEMPDLPALKDFQRKARLKIDEADVPGAVKSRLRGKFQAAALEREKVLGKLRAAKP